MELNSGWQLKSSRHKARGNQVRTLIKLNLLFIYVIVMAIDSVKRELDASDNNSSSNRGAI